MLRNIGAAIIGVLVGAIVVFFLEKIGHAVFPAPADIDLSDLAAVRVNLARMPIGAKLFIVLSWFGGALVGSVAALIVGRRWAPLAVVIGFTIFGLAVMSLISVAHAWWMWPGAFAGCGLGVYLAVRLTGARAALPPKIDPMPGL